MNEPLVSICIPAYKKPQYVVRVLDSVLKQDYKNIEIIISDDSPDEDTKHAIEPYRNQLSIRYFHNVPALKTPRNWNHALQQGEGDYLVLMHQDDWYHTTDAVSTYLEAFKTGNADFVFCRNTAVDANGNETVLQHIPSLLKRLYKNPNHLVLAQVIGPPSNTMLRKGIDVYYDERFIWLVDVDYYARLLKNGNRYKYIDKHLVSIGIHEDQTTAFCRANNDIIFRENIWFAGKIEPEAFHDILIYDYYWRLLRNDSIKTVADIRANGVEYNEIPAVILHMLHFQSRFSTERLKNGLVSKSLMFWNYLAWRAKKSKGKL
ncbi:MAG TPA: glycosyltransferase family 2 protein [Flavisolibacter sp.]|jgi:glycosyltransferase involved in cell wall biosynthesis|nr:glycosyltransferase family 2 protein [Flavisolibacter sp.]